MVATFQATKLLERVVFWYDKEVRFTSRNHVNMRVPVSSKRILESGMKRSFGVFPEPPDTVPLVLCLQNSGGIYIPFMYNEKD